MPVVGHQHRGITIWITSACRLPRSRKRKSAVTWRHTVSRWDRSSAATELRVMAIQSTCVIPRAILSSCAIECRPVRGQFVIRQPSSAPPRSSVSKTPSTSSAYCPGSAETIRLIIVERGRTNTTDKPRHNPIQLKNTTPEHLPRTLLQ